MTQNVIVRPLRSGSDYPTHVTTLDLRHVHCPASPVRHGCLLSPLRQPVPGGRNKAVNIHGKLRAFTPGQKWPQPFSLSPILALQVRDVRGSARHISNGRLLSPRHRVLATKLHSPPAYPDKKGQSLHGSPQYWPFVFATATAARESPRDETVQCNESDEDERATTSGKKGGRRSPFDADTFNLDYNDPNDRAFELVTQNDFPINKALTWTQATVTYQGLWQRVQCYNDSKALKEREDAAATTLASLSKEGWLGSETRLPTPRTDTASTRRKPKCRVTPPSDLGLTTFDSSPTPRGQASAAAVEAEVESMPAWVDKERVKGVVTKQKRRNGGLVNEHNFNSKAKKAMLDARHKRAFTLAIDEPWDLRQKGELGNHGKGLCVIAKK